MEKIANLELEDSFAWGVWQKIRLTGNRTITFNEIENFAIEVGKKAKDLGFKFSANFSKDITIKFINEYRNFISYNNKEITLNSNLTFNDTLNIFHMGVIPVELTKVMLDDSIGKKIFISKENSPQLLNN